MIHPEKIPEKSDGQLLKAYENGLKALDTGRWPSAIEFTRAVQTELEKRDAESNTD